MAKPAPKRSQNKRIGVLKVKGSSNPDFQNQKPFTPPSPASLINRLSGLLILGAALSGVFHQIALAVILAGVWLVIQISILFRGKQPAWLKKLQVRLGPSGGVGLILVFWIAVSAVMLTYPTFSWLFPKIQSLPFQQSLWMLLVMFIGLVVAFRQEPGKLSEAELSPVMARFWLGAALVLAAIINLHHPSEPVGTYWEDNSCFLYDIRRIKDLGDYHSASFIFDFGKRPPLFDYFVIWLWKLIPGVSGLFIMRFACALCNLGTVWLLYLCGKEIGGRKTGVLAAAFGAISKPLLQYCLLNMCIVFIPFSVALAFLFFFRLMKKPDLKHFLLWGAAVSFGIYTYSTYRPYIPLFIFAVFVWILFQKNGRSLEKPVGPAVWATAAVFLVFFFYTNSAFPYDNWIARMIDVAGSFFPCLVAVGLGLLTLAALPKLAGEKKSSKWFGWLTGSWLCVILSFPIMANENLMARVNNLKLIQGPGVLSGQYLLQTFQRLKMTLSLLFLSGTNENDNSMIGDSFFSFGEGVVIALGLAFFFAKPSWKRGFIFIAAVIGFLPHAIMTNPHPGRLLGCIVPFFLLGALGLNEFLNRLLLLPKGRVFYRVACILLIGFWGWSAQASVSRVFDQWSEKDLGVHTLVLPEACKDEALGNRIYFEPRMFNEIAYPLEERNKIYPWLSTNVIFLAATDKPQDVVVYLEPDLKDANGLVKDQLTRDFPAAQWKELRNPLQSPVDPPSILRCFIPFPDIAAHPSPFFEVKNAPMPYWDRQYSVAYGLVFDLIDYEDKVVNVFDPSPRAQLGEAARYEGTIHVGNAGNYKVHWKTPNRTEVKIDGRTLLNLYFPVTNQFVSPPERSGTASIHLEVGNHEVEVVTYFQQSTNPADISLQRSGLEGQGQSLWSSFDF